MSQSLTGATAGPATPIRTIAFVTYPGITLLDLAGPLQVCSALQDLSQDFRTVVLGERIEPMRTDTPLAVLPSHTFDEVPEPFALVVPGGLAPTLTALADGHLLDRLRQAASQAHLVGSVCTGSLLLGAAGLLRAAEPPPTGGTATS